MASKPYGTTGDRDPFTYGGGIVYVDDETGDAVWVVFPDTEEDLSEPEEDDDGNEIPSDETTSVHIIHFGDDVIDEHDWIDVKRIAQYVGMSPSEWKRMGRSKDPMDRARVLEDILRFWGPENLGAHTRHMTRAELLAEYDDDHDAALRAEESRRRSNPAPEPDARNAALAARLARGL